MKKVIVGQDKMVNRLLIGLFTNVPSFWEGVPGLAKTLRKYLGEGASHWNFNRISLRPIYYPSDLIGNDDLQTTAEWKVWK